MSHFTKVQTKIKNLTYLLAAIKDLGYEVVHGETALQVRGWHGAYETADAVIKISKTYDVGIRLNAKTGSYEFIADWWGVEVTRGLTQKQFIDQVMQRYAYHVVVNEVKEKGYTVVEEKAEVDNRVTLKVRRWA